MAKKVGQNLPKTYMKFLENYEAELAKKVKKKGLTITISGPSGSGKSAIAKAIAKAFKLKYCFAGEIFRNIAKKRGISLEQVSKTREKEIDYETDRRSLKFAMGGNVVLDARLSGWVAGDWADVKIYVYVNSEKVKAQRVAERDGISIIEAKKKIKQRDRYDNSKYRQLYNINQFNTSIYDIIIDNSKLTYEHAKRVPVKIVREFLRK